MDHDPSLELSAQRIDQAESLTHSAEHFLSTLEKDSKNQKAVDELVRLWPQLIAHLQTFGIPAALELVVSIEPILQRPITSEAVSFLTRCIARLSYAVDLLKQNLPVQMSFADLQKEAPGFMLNPIAEVIPLHPDRLPEKIADLTQQELSRVEINLEPLLAKVRELVALQGNLDQAKIALGIPELSQNFRYLQRLSVEIHEMSAKLSASTQLPQVVSPVLEGILVRSGGQHFVIPLSQIAELSVVRARHIEKNTETGEESIERHHERYRLIHLDQFLGLENKRLSHGLAAAVIPKRKTGNVLLVDDMEGTQKFIVKPSTDFDPSVTGITTHRDGTSVLVLDLDRVLSTNEVAGDKSLSF